MNVLAASTCCVNNAGVFGNGGSISDRALGVYTWVFWSSVVLGVIVTALLIYAFIKFRRRSDDEEPSQFHGNTRLEIAWTLVPLATFLSLFGLTAANMPFINDIHAGSQYTVTVIGVQFSWTFDYGTTSSGSRIRSFGTLYLPMNTDVGLDIVSTDPPCNAKPSVPSGSTLAKAIADEGCGVNHSFYAPSLGQQMNAIPGDVNTAPINAREGTYYGQCTELCGTGHATMTFVVVSLPMNQFQSCVFGNPSGSIDATSKACTLGGS
ncbi:MAG TPA: cytochrome c oxidase subunit II transmembrane domain-containing protein [Candidatus Dormibacteraeota bacterium]|jgi:cytochrome c oxidase subunit 2